MESSVSETRKNNIHHGLPLYYRNVVLALANTVFRRHRNPRALQDVEIGPRLQTGTTTGCYGSSREIHSTFMAIWNLRVYIAELLTISEKSSKKSCVDYTVGTTSKLASILISELDIAWFYQCVYLYLQEQNL